MRRYRLIRASLHVLTRLYSTVLVERAANLPDSPAILCFNHQNWADPFFLFGWLPAQPRLYFFGPEQEDMRKGFRNRLMRWGGVAVPYQPGKRGLLAATRRVDELLAGGSSLAIAGEGRIHGGEGSILPLLEGPAFIAWRSRCPIVPIAINGTFWLGFRRVVRIRVGRAIWPEATMAADDGAAVARLTAQTRAALAEMVADFPDREPPGPIGRRLTELFNDWPEGARPEIRPE
jgi:1-acyl-sn-glycerol-3-phosphate acyltransferase